MKLYLKKWYVRGGYVFYGAIFLTFFIQFFYFSLALHLSTPSWFFKVFSAIADSCVFLLPCFLLRGKWRYLSFILPFLISVLLWANLLYFRNFNDLIPSSQYINNQVGDTTVVNSIIPSSRFGDVILGIIPFFPLFVAVLTGWRNVMNIRFTKTLFAIFIIILSGAWCVTIIGAYRRVAIYTHSSSFSEVVTYLYPIHSTEWIFFYSQHNFTGYMVRSIAKMSNPNLQLSQEDISNIQKYFNSKYVVISRENNDHEKPDNLIMIVVESLPMQVFELKNHNRIIPVLTSLVSDTLNIERPPILKKCKVLTGLGRSSDGQFIFNTGLLPLQDEPLVSNYAHKDYPSIAKALKINSIEVIGEKSNLWSHAVTNKSYGYDVLVSDIAVNCINQDSLIFSKAEEILDTISQPFFMFVSTLSMHSPYTEPNVEHLLNSRELEDFRDSRDREYLQRTHYFDKSLGEFIDFLKNNDKYDKTLIVLIGDHDIGKSDVSEKLYDDYVPFIILNSPNKKYKPGAVAQTDVFPTIMEIFQIDYEYMGAKYSGLGNSIFSHPQDSVAIFPTQEDYKISEMIIKQ